MVPEFSNLTASETELVFKAPLLVCLLIAGADGKIDSRELSEAINMSRERSWVPPNIESYYNEVAEDFEDKIKMLIQSYPYDTTQRNQIITEELAQLNVLWSKLGDEFSAALLTSLKYAAQRIASSSGNFWGKISAEEAALLNLPMLAQP
jgi:hypothetical protein